MRRFLSIAALTAAAAGLAYASYTVFNKKKNSDENIDDLVYTEDFDDAVDLDDDAYFEVEIEEELQPEEDIAPVEEVKEEEPAEEKPKRRPKKAKE